MAITISGSGIVEANIADNAVTLAKMAGGTDGNIITYDTSGNPAVVATGSDGQILTSAGADAVPAFEAAAAGGATVINELTDVSMDITDFVDGLLIQPNSDGSAPTTGTLSTATGNTGIGKSTFAALTSGTYNTALGYNTLPALTTGTKNVGIGYNALVTNIEGDKNTAVGRGSLYTTTADDNTALGTGTGYYVSTGTQNTIIGASAGEYGTTGLTQTGSNNTVLGTLSGNGGGNPDNTFTMGDNRVSDLRCNDTSISALSDQRDKAEITDLPDEAGLDLINALRPVTYYWDRREWYEDSVTDGSKIKRDYRPWKSNSGQRQGFVAQEVETAISGHKYLEDSRVVSGTEDKKEFAPAHLLINAIKAIQQLSAEVETLKAEVATLKGV